MQFLDSATLTRSKPALSTETVTALRAPSARKTDWLDGADDWGEEAENFGVKALAVTAMEEGEEENGNFVPLDNGKNVNRNLNLVMCSSVKSFETSFVFCPSFSLFNFVH